MEFRRIEYFLVLAEKLNYAKAANELCISSQALTKQINLLEEELGTKLFDRTTRSVALTEDGIMCRNQFANLKSVYDETLAAVEDALRKKKQVVRLGFFGPLPKKELINPMIHTLISQFPEIDFQISTANMDELRDQLKDGKLDLVLTNAHDFEDWQGCEHIVFKSAPAQIVLSSKHHWVKEKKKKITAKDMEPENIILMVKHGPYEFNSFYGKVKTMDRTMVPDFDSLMLELEKGKGFAVFPMVFNDVSGSGFVSYDLPDEYRFNFRTMCSYRKSNKDPEVRKVFNYIKKNKKLFQF